MITRCTAALGLALAMATWGATAAEVVALGASNTEGRGRGATADGVPRSQAFPAQLQQMLAAQGCRARVANAGIAGDTTGGMLQRMPKVIAKDTRVLILQPGGNDARRGEAADRESNIASIKAFAAARGIDVIILESLNRIASGYRLADGQHYSFEGHTAFARYLAPSVLASAACRA